MTAARTGSSFRDPSGFLFVRDGVLLRQVNASFREEFDAFVASGLYDALVADGLLVAHRERPATDALDDRVYRVLQPDVVPWVSYPYEWSPTQLRDAALLTLRVQSVALAHGMVLKDASAFNVQFLGHRPVFIDTLSFERYAEGAPWVAYRQFCQHFLGPLAAQTLRDARLRELSRSYLDGPPLDLISALLPRRTWVRPSLLAHVHLHARSVARHAERAVPERVAKRGVSRRGLEAVLSHLEGGVRRLRWTAHATEWAQYDSTHNYSEAGQAAKEAFVREAAADARPRLALDLGANTGHYSKILRDAGAYVVAADGDLGAVEALLRQLAPAPTGSILPLWIDLANPAPAQGWAHTERLSVAERGPVDLALALALVHHLAIGNNVPLESVAAYLAQLCRRLVIEWVPKSDPQVSRLLVSRRDVFPDYTEDAFLRACGRWFTVDRSHRVAGTERVLHMMSRR